MDNQRKAHPRGKCDLNLITQLVPEDKYLCGILWTARGWYYYWQAQDPQGMPLSGQMIGPFESEQEAIDAAE